MDFDSCELVRNSIRTLDQELRVSSLQYTIQRGVQEDHVSYDQLGRGEGFRLATSAVEISAGSVGSMVAYDLLGKIAENTQLTRKTVAAILSGIQQVVFNQFRHIRSILSPKPPG